MTEVSVQTDAEAKSNQNLIFMSEQEEDSNIESIKLLKAYLKENINFMKLNN